MTGSDLPRLVDITDAIVRIMSIMHDVSLDTFEADWQRQWLVERGLAIVSEASRHLSTELKSRHPGIPWQKVAGIGNVLRHDYGQVSAPVLWKLVRDDLAPLAQACRAEQTAN